MAQSSLLQQIKAGAFIVLDCQLLERVAANLSSQCQLNTEYHELTDPTNGFYFRGNACFVRTKGKVIFMGLGQIEWHMGSSFGTYQAGWCGRQLYLKAVAFHTLSYQPVNGQMQLSINAQNMQELGFRFRLDRQAVMLTMQQRGLEINLPLMVDFLGDVNTPVGSPLCLLLEWDLANLWSLTQKQGFCDISNLTADTFWPDIVGNLSGTLTWNARRWTVLIDATHVQLLHVMTGAEEFMDRSQFWACFETKEGQQRLGDYLEALIINRPSRNPSQIVAARLLMTGV